MDCSDADSWLPMSGTALNLSSQLIISSPYSYITTYICVGGLSSLWFLLFTSSSLQRPIYVNLICRPDSSDVMWLCMYCIIYVIRVNSRLSHHKYTNVLNIELQLYISIRQSLRITPLHVWPISETSNIPPLAYESDDNQLIEDKKIKTAGGFEKIKEKKYLKY